MTEKQYYQMGTFLVEDELFYEDDNRLGFFEDETEENIKRNNHMGTVDRLWELRTLNIHLKRNNKKFRKENEQLKSVVKEVIELLSEEVDLFSDKATEHDINAYIELKELDNKDAYYMATATKKAIKLLKGVVDD